MNEFKAGIIINYASITLRLASSFFMTPFILSKLGVDEYSLFVLSNGVITWLALTDLGLGDTVKKYIITYHSRGELEKQKYFLGQILVLFAVLGLITLIVGLLCYSRLNVFFPALNEDQLSILRILYLLTLSELVLSFPLRPLVKISEAYLKFLIPGVISLVASLLSLVLSILLLTLGYKAIALTVLSIVISVFSSAIGLVYSFKYLGIKVKFSKPDFSLYKEVFSFSFWVLINQLMNMFYWQAGTPVVARLCGASDVPVFSMGISIVSYFMTATTAISTVIAPKIMSQVARGADSSEITQSMIRSGRIQLIPCAIFLLTFAIIGKDFLALWVGQSLGSGVETIWLGAMCILVPLTIPMTQLVGPSILQAMNIHKGRAVILFYSSILCIISGYIFTYLMGPIGMFIGTALSLTVGQIVLLNLYYVRMARLNMLRFWKETFKPVLLPSFMLLALGLFLHTEFLVQGWTSFVIFTMVYVAISISTMFFLYLRKDERETLIRPIKHYFKSV